jgi:hypothetical protein
MFLDRRYSRGEEGADSNALPLFNSIEGVFRRRAEFVGNQKQLRSRNIRQKESIF